MRIGLGLVFTLGPLPLGHAQEEEESAGFREYFPDGFEAEFEFTVNNEYERNVDLDDDEDTDIGVTEIELAAALAYEVTDWVTAELELVLGRDFFFIDDEKDESPDLRLELDRALLVLSDIPLEGLEIGLGRQKITDEPRKFVVDEALDGLRVGYENEPFVIDAALGRERRVDKDLLNDEDDDENPDVDYASLFLDYRLKEGLVAGPYFFYLDDHEGEESQRTYFGLRSSGAIAPQLLHWLDLSYVKGDEGDTDIEGIAFDSAISYLWDVSLSPSISFGYAFGSGDDGEDDGDSDAFRQTGLQANEAKFHGLPRFKYLGEAFDPELSNLHILTAGIGVRGDTVSADLVYHHYRLDKTGGELGDSRIDADLRENSRDDHVGDGVDLVFGFREIAGFENVGADLVGGWFRPGDAFAEDNDDDAFFVKFEVAVEF